MLMVAITIYSSTMTMIQELAADERHISSMKFGDTTITTSPVVRQYNRLHVQPWGTFSDLNKNNSMFLSGVLLSNCIAMGPLSSNECRILAHYQIVLQWGL